MTDTIFSKIIRKEIPAEIVFESEDLIAFRDINPQAPVHILVVPKKTIAGISAAGDADQVLLGRMLLAARDIAAKEGLNASGYRLVINNGERAGQSVFHLHLHILGGRDFGWPPG